MEKFPEKNDDLCVCVQRSRHFRTWMVCQSSVLPPTNLSGRPSKKTFAHNIIMLSCTTMIRDDERLALPAPAAIDILIY